MESNLTSKKKTENGQTFFHLDEESYNMILEIALFYNENHNQILTKNEVIDKSIAYAIRKDNFVEADIYRIKTVNRDNGYKNKVTISYTFFSSDDKKFISDFIQFYKSYNFKIYMNSVFKTFIYEYYIYIKN